MIVTTVAVKIKIYIYCASCNKIVTSPVLDVGIPFLVHDISYHHDHQNPRSSAARSPLTGSKLPRSFRIGVCHIENHRPWGRRRLIPTLSCAAVVLWPRCRNMETDSLHPLDPCRLVPLPTHLTAVSDPLST